MALAREVEFEISEFNDEQFDIEQSIVEAKKNIDLLVQENRWISGEFEDDHWVVEQERKMNYRSYFHFEEFNSNFFNSPNKEFKNIVKCWVVSNICKLTTKTVQNNLLHLKKFFNETKGFKKEEVDTLKRFIEHYDASNLVKYNMVSILLNFFDYSDLEIGNDFVPALCEFRDKMPVLKNHVRQLPASRYVLSFSYYLEKHFEYLLRSQIEKQAELLEVYPLIIWWRLTTLIPIRVLEFCRIERDCLIENEEKYFIQLPRQKQPINRVQILDKIPIDQDMYRLISNYIELTKEFGDSKTLISYRSLAETNADYNPIFKMDMNSFTPLLLGKLIQKFYKIMETEYNCAISNPDQVHAGDTRHFAFMSLMQQGYTSIEIARLGGHSTVAAQYHYQAHQEYWVDCEVFKLMKKIKNKNLDENESGDIPDEVKKKVQIVSGAKPNIKLKIGFCKDESQSCESRSCYFCSHWGISAQEYIEKKEKILSDVLLMKKNINETASVIQNLNKQFLKDSLNRQNPEILKRIKTKSNALQSDIYKIALLTSKIGGGEVLDGEQIDWS